MASVFLPHESLPFFRTCPLAPAGMILCLLLASKDWLPRQETPWLRRMCAAAAEYVLTGHSLCLVVGLP